jgi:hypothetical protein
VHDKRYRVPHATQKCGGRQQMPQANVPSASGRFEHAAERPRERRTHSSAVTNKALVSDDMLLNVLAVSESYM